jgi:pyrrolidone-carboxylate peptidase
MEPKQLPSEVKVLKGSKSGVIVAGTVPGRTSLKPNEVAIRLTHSGVGFNCSKQPVQMSANSLHRFAELIYTISTKT